MGGVEAAGGFAYQHAQAIQLALGLVENEDLARIRVEATNDLVDVEVWSRSDALVEGCQFKKRSEKDTWGQQELIDQLADWSGIALRYPSATYRFVTNGRLGRTGRKVRDALLRASEGDVEEISAFMSSKAKKPFVIDTMLRASIVSDEANYQGLIVRAETVSRALLLNVTSEAEAIERGRWVVLELLNLVTEKSGLPNPDERFITRDDVMRLLATPQDRIPTTGWNDELRATFHSSVLAQVPDDLIEMSCTTDSSAATLGQAPAPDASLLEDRIALGSTCLLGGPSGSGNSTALLSMQRRAAAAGQTVIVCSAESYIPGRLPALIAAGLNLHTYIGAHPAVGTAALADPHVIVAIDGLSEVPVDVRRALAGELKPYLGANPRSTLVLAGRETTALRAALGRNIIATDLIVSPLSEVDQRALVERFYKCGPDVASELARQASQKMHDVATNPLMLLLGVRAILLNDEATNPAAVFQSVVRAIADDSGYVSASLYEVALGMAFSRLLDQERRYCDTVTWGKLLAEVADELSTLGHDLTASEIREFGTETGLVRVAQFDSVRPAHDSFADYLAAAAVHHSMTALPEHLGSHDRARATFVAQLSGAEPSIAFALTRDLPLAAVSTTPYEKRSPDDGWLAETQRHLDHLLPADTRHPKLAYWVDSSGRRIVTIDGPHEGWWESSAPDGKLPISGWTFPLVDGQGPLFVAVQIWRRHLDQLLSPPANSGVGVPRTIEESTELLTEHSARLRESVGDLTEALNLPATEAESLFELAEHKMQFRIQDGDVEGDERDRSVRFREIDAQSAGPTVIVGDNDEGITWTGWGRVDSFVITGPIQSAMRTVRAALNRLVGRIWL